MRKMTNLLIHFLIYGSNIFDICIGIGFPVLIYTLLYGSINMSISIDRIGWLEIMFLMGIYFYGH